MTLPEIAQRFARDCLGWVDATLDAGYARHVYTKLPKESLPFLTPGVLPYENLGIIESFVTVWLGQRFSIQINRGRSNLFSWSVLIGVQNVVVNRGKPLQNACADGENLGQAMMEACINAHAFFGDVVP